ncbi:cytochrome P450 [Aspergillus ambiguus]|uniref:cytochrome P450 n=1 Tax=Aspergillus ambiguus TaxID=176160 RepID=UPI003CCE28FB
MDSPITRKAAYQLAQGWNISSSVSVIIAVIYCIYQIYFHPLSRFPGPISSKLCNARALYYALKGDSHLDILRCHQKYGPVIRYTPSTVIWNNTTGLKGIYGVRRRVRKTRNYRFFDQGIQNILTATDKNIHANRRRLLNPCFTDTAIKAYEPRILYHAQRFCHMLCPLEARASAAGQPSWGPAIDMSEWCAYLAFDLMTEFVFGKGSNLLEKPKNRALLPMAEASLDWVARLYYLQLPHPELLTRVLFKIVNRRHGIFTRYIQANLKDRQNLSPKDRGSDIFSYLVGSYDGYSEAKLSLEEIQSECQLLSVAGFDTVSTALCATIFYLVHYPHAYTRLANEIRTAFRSTTDIQPGEKLKACEYLNACINESLRISPPISTIVPREVEKGGELIDGDFVPEGCVVGTSIYAIQRNPEYFPQPHVYLPERWLTADKSHANAAFIPFSVGSRACIGKTMAMSELQTTIALFIWTFDFRLPDGYDGTGAKDSVASKYKREGTKDVSLRTSHLLLRISISIYVGG